MARPVNKYQEERDERQKMGGVWFTDVRVEVFEEGVDATLELLRPLLRPVSTKGGDRWAVERYVGIECTGCANDKGDGHFPTCPWPKIDELMATLKRSE